MRKLVATFALVMTVITSNRDARAEPDSAVDTTPLARRMFEEGVDAARRLDWSTALDKFAKSYEVAPRPLTLYNLAGAQVATNRFVRGSESYRRFLRATADGNYPEFRKEAQTALGTIEPKIAWLRLQVTRLSSADQLLLDGEAIAQAVVGESMPIDPGRHTVVVKRGGAPDVRSDFTMAEGSSKTVVLDLPAPAPVPAPVSVTGVEALRSPPPPAKPEPREDHWYRSRLVWGIVVGSAAVIGGGTYLYLRSRPYDASLGAVDVNGRATP